MQTMTTITDVTTTPGGGVVATVLGGKKAGTTNAELGAKLQAIFARDPEHCMVELELEKRGERLHITRVEYIENPLTEEDEGKAEITIPEETGASDAAAEPESAVVNPPAPNLSLEDLTKLHDRVFEIEQFLMTKGFQPS